MVDRLYRLLLGLYPREFRRLYGPEMRDAFRALHERVRRESGPTALPGLWARTLLDAVRSGFRERLNRRGYRVNLRSSLRFPRSGVASLVSDLSRDTRYALRTLGRAPGYAAVVVVTLALGIGANTALFSMVHGILVEPLPFGGGRTVVHVEQQDAGAVGDGVLSFSVKEIDDYRRHAETLTDLAEYHRMSFVLTGRGEPDRVRVGVVSHNFFDLLEIRPALGREFVAAEDRAGADPVLLLSDGYWRRKFDADPDVVGTRVTMNSEPHTIVGVLPPFPQFPEENDVYMPVSVCPTRSDPDFIADRQRRMMSVYGRLAPDATMEDARWDIGRAADSVKTAHPDIYFAELGYDADVRPVREELVAGVREPLLLLLGVTGFVLLIACANAANMALARTERRSTEMAVRGVLGAERGRLLRQLLTENMILALAGGALGLLMALGGVELLVAVSERFTPRAQEVEVDGVVLGFTLLASVGAGVLFGLVPVLGERFRTVEDLSTEGMTASRRSRRIRSALVVVQVAVAFAVLSGAGLMLRSVWALHTVDVGVDTEEVLAFRLTLDEASYPTLARGDRFIDEVMARLRDVPEVMAVARAMEVPLGESHSHRDVFTPVGEEELPGLPAEVRTVGSRYFEVVGSRIVAGRGFTPADDLDGPFVAVVNRTFAERAFPDGDGVGRRLRQCWEGGCNTPMTVVGVVEDVRYHGAEAEVPPEVYRSGRQVEFAGLNVLLRTRGDAEAVAPLVKQVVHSVDADVPVSDLATLRALRSSGLAPRRLTAGLLLLFAGVAVGLSVAGVFGVMSLAASARTREIGIRKALGAHTSEVRGMVVREGMALVVTGLVVGLALALAAGSALSGVLWGVDAGDPFTLGTMAGLFLAVSALACYLPARRASATDVRSTLQTG